MVYPWQKNMQKGNLYAAFRDIHKKTSLYTEEDLYVTIKNFSPNKVTAQKSYMPIFMAMPYPSAYGMEKMGMMMLLR